MITNRGYKIPLKIEEKDQTNIINDLKKELNSLTTLSVT